MSRNEQENTSFAEGVTVWLVSAADESVGPAIFWERDDAEGFVSSNRGRGLRVRGLVMRGERHRCRLCGEPIVLDDPADPESWRHADDANDGGTHTADP